MFDNSELNCLNFYNGRQWGFQFAVSFTMGHDLFFWNKYCFANRSQIDPPHCCEKLKQGEGSVCDLLPKQ